MSGHKVGNADIIFRYMMTIYIFVLLAKLKSDGGGICNRLGGNLRGLSIGNTAELVYLLGERDVERIYFMVKYFY